MNTDKNSLLEISSKNTYYRDIPSLVYKKKHSLSFCRPQLDIGLEGGFLDGIINFIGGLGLFLGRYRSMEVLC